MPETRSPHDPGRRTRSFDTFRPEPASTHWIGGRLVAGTSGRHGDVYDPAAGHVHKHVDFASVEEIDAAVAAAKAAFPGWRSTSLTKRTDILFRIRNLVDERRHALAAHLTAEHGKVPSDALGEIARGIENLEFALWPAEPAQGRLQRTGDDRHRRVPDPPAAGGRRGHHARSTSRRWCRCGCSRRRSPAGNTFILKPSEKDPSASIFIAELLARGGRARRRLQRRPWRQGGRRRDPRPPRYRGGQLRRVDPDRALHLRDRHEERQARAGARRRQEPHGRAARRRHRHGRRRGRLGRLRLGRRAVHGGRHGRGRRRRRRSARRGDQGRACRRSRSGPAPTPTAEMGPLVTRSTATRSPATSIRRRRRARRSSPTGASTRSTTSRDGLLPRRVADRPRHARDGRATATRSSARC